MIPDADTLRKLIARLRDHEVSPYHGGCQDCHDVAMDDAADALEAVLAAQAAPGEASRLPDGHVVVPLADYNRLLAGCEADDMITKCDTCGAWLDRDDPACATTDDFTGCWKAAAGRPQDDHLCRSYRAPDVIAASLHRPVEARVTEAGCAQPDGEHDWFIPERIGCECCRKCGIVRRADGKNKPCKGQVRVGPRDSSLPSPQVTRGEVETVIREWNSETPGRRDGTLADRILSLFDGKAKP